MKKIKLLGLTLFALFSLSIIPSCTDGFREMNVDPNRSPKALPESLLAPSLTELVKRHLNRAMRLTNELMQVHVTLVDSDEIHRYVIRTAEADYMWTNWYTELTNIRDIYTGGKETSNKTYMGISLILDAWVTSLLTDTFGDVPYFEANKGREGIFMPAFDKQQDIYTDIFQKLDSANILLTGAANLAGTQADNDPLYKGNAANWRKMGNSLYLRLLLRVSGKTEPVANGVTAMEKIKEMVDTNPGNYPIFASNAESAILKFTGTVPYQSEFQLYRAYDFNGSSALSSFFVDNLTEWGDPRIMKWATLEQGVYGGIQSGYEVSKIPVAKSRYLPALTTEPLLGNIINYPEVQFILAEAAAKGWISGSAKTYYDRGTTNAITLWGLEVPAGHLAKENVKLEDNFTLDTKMERIHLQKYYTLFFTDFQQWYEYRRTGYPTLEKGPGLRNEGQMPARLNYPLYVQSLNGANYQAAVAAQGPDNINTKVWWQR
jgi:hypothetical protein